MHIPLRDRVLATFLRRRWRGFFTLHRLMGRRSIVAATRYASIFSLNLDDYIDGIVLREDYYESEVLEAMRPYLRSDTVLWDVGACFGLHSITAKVLVPDLEVHAFEPNSRNLARIERHSALNRAVIRAWPIALSDRDGVGTLHRVEVGNTGLTTLQPRSGRQYDSTAPVKLARAQTLIESGQVPSPHIVKLDVEGAEATVLTGFGDYLRSPRLSAIVIEARADLHLCPGADVVGSLLIGAGFSITALSRNEQSSTLVENFLARRESRNS